MNILKSFLFFFSSIITCVVMFGGGYIYAQGAGITLDGFGSALHIVDVTDNELALQGTDKKLDKELIDVIKGAVNWVLGILALIALLLLMYGGFQMVTAAGNEDQYGAGFKILKNAAIGLAIIGVARFIVSIIFFVINIATTRSVGTDGGTFE